ncbi:MAG: DJ-1/PfpI family protein [Candidatus Woesearchaeota archaeon]
MGLKKIVFLIAQEGFQDIELFDTKDELSKKGIDSQIASFTTDAAHGKLGAVVMPDLTFDEINPDFYVGIIIVGGPGATSLQNKIIYDVLHKFEKQNKLVGAICYSGAVLAKAGITRGKKSTVWKSEETIRILKENGVNFVDEDVVVDGNIITANGPKAARQFGQEIAKFLKG